MQGCEGCQACKVDSEPAARVELAPPSFMLVAASPAVAIKVLCFVNEPSVRDEPPLAVPANLCSRFVEVPSTGVELEDATAAPCCCLLVELPSL
jgi:hypothetical protein